MIPLELFGNDGNDTFLDTKFPSQLTESGQQQMVHMMGHENIKRI